MRSNQLLKRTLDAMNTGRSLLAFAAVSCMFMAPATAGQQSFDESFAMRSGATYIVQLSQSRAARLDDRLFVQYGHWGAEGASQSFCLSSLKVKRRAASVPVPGKAFADLCNVTAVQLSERKGLFVLSLSGGDASDSFNAEFLFRGVYLIERTVRHGGFPEHQERTTYRYAMPEN